MTWAKAEMSGVDLGDRRLNNRVVKLLEILSQQPSASIPDAFGGWAETKAAYPGTSKNLNFKNYSATESMAYASVFAVNMGFSSRPKVFIKNKVCFFLV